MEYKDLNPEDKQLVEAEMCYSRSVIRNVILTNVLLLGLLSFLNLVICKYFQLPKDAVFFIQFLTSILIRFACSGAVNDEAIRFTEEVNKITKK